MASYNYIAAINVNLIPDGIIEIIKLSFQTKISYGDAVVETLNSVTTNEIQEARIKESSVIHISINILTIVDHLPSHIHGDQGQQ